MWSSFSRFEALKVVCMSNGSLEEPDHDQYRNVSHGWQYTDLWGLKGLCHSCALLTAIQRVYPNLINSLPGLRVTLWLSASHARCCIRSVRWNSPTSFPSLLRAWSRNPSNHGPVSDTTTENMKRNWRQGQSVNFRVVKKVSLVARCIIYNIYYIIYNII